MIVTFYVEGEARGKQRPRTVRKDGVLRTYTPKETKEYEQLVKSAYMREAKGAFFTGPVCVMMTVIVELPKSMSKAKQQEILIKDSMRPTKRPDLDNVAKSVCDALNKTAYKDDAQIVRLCVSRHYGGKNGVYVTISEVQNEFSMS
jgi:Holliday junction resolvase RusA-like endonuclease